MEMGCHLVEETGEGGDVPCGSGSEEDGASERVGAGVPTCGGNERCTDVKEQGRYELTGGSGEGMSHNCGER